MDKELKREIMATVRIATEQATQRVMEMRDERWVSEKELRSKFAFFTPTWMRYYGRLLPRTRPVVTDENGKEHEGSWNYPLNKIAFMVANNEIKNLKISTNGTTN